VFYTTNGTKSIAKAKYSENLFTCSFLNISAVAKHLISLNTDVEIVCAGRNNYFSIEDSICAGMLISKLKKVNENSYLNDSGTAVLTLYEKYGSNLIKMMKESDHGKILLENGFDADLEYCSSIDVIDAIPAYANGVLKKLKLN
jgi:2-phosphosulfolactate phosphatase